MRERRVQNTQAAKSDDGHHADADAGPRAADWGPPTDPASDATAPFHVHEPLELSAPMAWRLAPSLCSHRDPATGQQCDWYHGLWQFLKLLEVVEGFGPQARFFRDAFDTVDGSADGPRVLVAGAADYVMLAYVLSAFRARGVEPRVAVVDWCRTPLELNRWYAQRVGATVELHCCDLLEYRDDRPFDAICTHALLGRFSPADRPRLADRWHSLLRPGGKVITVSPFRPGDGPVLKGFAPEQVKAFAALVAERAKALGPRLPIPPAELAEAADRYARCHRVYRVRSEGELRAMFEGRGLALEHLSFSSPESSVGPAVNGPTVAGGAVYARIVARRDGCGA